jgi:hypothetical protein
LYREGVMAGIIESLEKAITKLHRKRIARQLYERSSKAVEYGPFKGMKLIEFSHISSSPLALKLFGLYEREVVDFLTSLKDRQTLINLGAGDGYYSVGLIMSGTVKRALSFEMDEKGRKAIAQNAAQNGVLSGVEIFGAADAALPVTLKAKGVDPASAVVLCDIEGAEFSVISRDLIAALPGAVYAIEIHDFMFADGAQKLEALRQSLAGSHDIEMAKARPAAWSDIPELEALHDNARALVTSDGRKRLGLWLFARPKSR